MSYASIPLKGASDSWSVITLHRESAAMAPVHRMIAVAAVVAVMVIAAAIVVIALLARRLTRPIVSITEMIRNASDGDFTVQAQENSTNEIGVLSKSLNKMTGKIATIAGEVVESSEHLNQIEEHMDAASQAVREILDGSNAQDADVQHVVRQQEVLGEKFGQLQEKSGFLLEDAENTIVSGENGMQCVAELRQQNEITSNGMADAYAKELLINNYLQNIPSCAILSSNISNCIGGKNGYTC